MTNKNRKRIPELTTPWATVIAAAITGICGIIGVILTVILITDNRNDNNPSPSNIPSVTNQLAAVMSETLEPTYIGSSEPSNTSTSEPTNTHTPHPTATPLDPAIMLAENGVSSNAEWDTPYIQEFRGVEMVLVPAGCFMMGSDIYEDEQPIHQQCFDEPFWIDRTEVTRAQYTECLIAGNCVNRPVYYYSRDDIQPINRVTWFQALDYCRWCNTRLPTEREWEYTARGPSNLTYPWGNDFVADSVVYSGNSLNQSAEVGSRLDGASWVGTLDMSVVRTIDWTRKMK